MILVVMNQKGGCGKTTTVAALSSGLKHIGKKVLTIDIDPQCNLTSVCGINDKSRSVIDVLLGKCSVAEATQSSPLFGDIVPSAVRLIAADALLTGNKKEFLLKKALSSVSSQYDFVLIDTPPAVNVLTINALTAADSVLIPVPAEQFALDGLTQMAMTLHEVKQHTNQKLKTMGIVITRCNLRTSVFKLLSERIASKASELSIPVLHSRIRECTAIREAQVLQTSIFSYSRNSNAVKDYQSLINEIIGGQN